jgi:aspartate carbamoyltransferase regulatory subunit
MFFEKYIKDLKKFSLVFAILFVFSCSSSSPKKEIPDIERGAEVDQTPAGKAKAAAEKGGGLFGDLNKKSENINKFEFSTSNILWRATLKSLEFLPLANADYSGGVIVYDWYSEKNSKEQIKVSIRFLSNELRSDSIQVLAHKRTCDTIENCSTQKLDNKFTVDIKDHILTTARSLKIEEDKKKN